MLRREKRQYAIFLQTRGPLQEPSGFYPDWVDEMPPMKTGSLGGGSGLENLLRFKLVMPVTWRWTCPAAEGVALREGLAHDN